MGCSPWGHEESDTTERLHFHFSLSCTGEGNGNPLHYSCLENPRDRGAWWAAIYGVTQSRTRLPWLSSSSSMISKKIPFFFLVMMDLFSVIFVLKQFSGSWSPPAMGHNCYSVRWSIHWLQIIGFPHLVVFVVPAAAAKSLRSCPTLCNPINGSPPGSAVPGILQARTLEWVAVSFSNAWKWKVKVKSLSRVRLLATPWTAAYQAPPSMGFPGKNTAVGCHCLLSAPKYCVWSALGRDKRRSSSSFGCDSVKV